MLSRDEQVTVSDGDYFRAFRNRDLRAGSACVTPDCSGTITSIEVFIGEHVDHVIVKNWAPTAPVLSSSVLGIAPAKPISAPFTQPKEQGDRGDTKRLQPPETIASSVSAAKPSPPHVPSKSDQPRDNADETRKAAQRRQAELQQKQREAEQPAQEQLLHKLASAEVLNAIRW